MVRFNGTQESFQSLSSQAKFDTIRDVWISQGDRKITFLNVRETVEKIKFFWDSLKTWREGGVPADQVSDFLSSKIALKRVVEPCKKFMDENKDRPINLNFTLLTHMEVKQTLDYLNKDNSIEAKPKIRYYPLPLAYKRDPNGGLIFNPLLYF